MTLCHYYFGVKKLPKVKKDTSYVLRVLRATYDWSQMDAARYFDISSAHWSLMESRLRKPSPKLAAKIAEVTGEPIEVVLGLRNAS